MSGAALGDPERRVPEVPLRETCRLVSGSVPLWPYHRRRLASGGCGERLLAAADAAVEREAGAWAGPNSSRLRLTLVATPDGRVDAVVQRRLSSLDVPAGPTIACVEVTERSPLPPDAAKPADRSWWDVAQRQARAEGANQAILVRDGRIVDGGSANVWVVVDGVLMTPSAPDAVAGVARAFLLHRCAAAGVPVRVGDVEAAALDSASEVFLTNAFAGAVAVRGRGGAVHASVAKLFADTWQA